MILINSKVVAPYRYWRRSPLSFCFSRAGALAGLLLAVAFCLDHAAAATFRLVALANSPAPGAGVKFSAADVAIPVLNSEGYVAFRSYLAGTGVNASNLRGLWVEGSAGLSLLAREGSPAPGTASGITFYSLDSVLGFNALGHAMFISWLDIPGVSGTLDGYGAWATKPSGLSKVVVLGDSAPGLPAGVSIGGASSDLFTTRLNNADQIAFRSHLGGTGVTSSNNVAIWSDAHGIGLQVIARTGNTAPGTTHVFRALDGPTFNDLGQTAFSGQANAGEYGVWAEGAAGLRLVGLYGQPVPGAPSGTTFWHFDPPVINNLGQTAFLAGATGTNSFTGVFSEGGGSGLKLVARSGAQAPGTGPGVNFTSLLAPVLNGSGNVAFESFLTGPGVVSGVNDNGIWFEKPGVGLTLLARAGDLAPGGSYGALFAGLGFPAFNKNGQIAFIATLQGSGLPTNANGIWALDREGQLQLIVRTGDMLEVAPGTFRQVSRVYFNDASGNEEGVRSGFNERGQLAFAVQFTGNSDWGTYVTDLVAVPEPAASSFLLFAFSILSVPHRNRRVIGR
jgi:hypothetical protein